MKYIYFRVSTEKQDYDQQRETVGNYLRRQGITEPLPTVIEKKSGAIKHTERKLSELLAKCVAGDTIYISELSRLGRNMTDLFNIITEASERGITIVQAKDGTIIENESIGGKALLFALSLAAEIELNNIRQRTRMGLAARKSEGKEIGGTARLWGSRNGNKDRATAIENATAASAATRREKARQNAHNKAFAEFMEYWQAVNGEPFTAAGWQAVADELNRRGKKTSTGMEFTKERARAMHAKTKRLYRNN